MIKNFLTVALRTMLRNKTSSAINIFGLAVGLACFWLILQYVTFERSYDQFHANKDRIFRVELDQYKSNELIFKSSENYPAVGPALLKDFPEIESYARLYNMGSKNNVVISYEAAPGGPINLKHRRFLYADSSFLPMFSYRMISGDAATALNEPFSIVISESYAKRYFGNGDPIGKFLHMRDDDFNDELCKVTGVVEDPPQNTHLKFDALISYKTLYTRFEKARFRYNEHWNRKDMYTYILLKPGTDVAALSARFAEFMKRHNPDLEKQFRRDDLVLQPLTDIHLYSKLTDEPEPNGNGNAVYFLTLIAISILLIAWINYVNLSTARSMDRAKEVGIRKVVGAQNNLLMTQFLVESFMTNFIALLLSFVIVNFTWPYFRDVTGTSATITLLTKPWFFVLAAAIYFGGSLMSGFYPALVLSSFKPVSVLKGKFSATASGVWLRKGLVVCQFAASAALIIGTIIVYRQLNFMRGYDLGLNIDQTIVVERPGVIVNRKDRLHSILTFKEELKKDPSIKNVAGAFVLPGKKLRFKGETRQMVQAKTQDVPVAFAGMDYDFLETFDMKILAGRNFSPDYPKDPDTSVILTQSAARLLGFTSNEDAIGKVLAVDEFQWNPIIVGVIPDYHHESLELETQPTIFMCAIESVEYFMIKSSTDDLPKTIGYIKDSWDRIFPGNPFEYFFLDEYFNNQYKSDQTFGKVFGLFALLAMLVGCLGLFGLSSFTISRRVKEIAIRKVCGAPLPKLLVELSRESFTLVMTASLLSWPVMYYVMNQWLGRFAYRIDVSWDVFAASALVMAVTALLTVGYHTTRASLANPVKFLRDE